MNASYASKASNTKVKVNKVKVNKVKAAPKFTVQKGGSNFGNYLLTAQKYIHVTDEEKILSVSEVNDLNYNGKIIGDMTGCFCPPHKGHLQAIYDVCHKYRIDVIFVRTVNGATKSIESRHGLPLSVTMKLLAKYAKYIYAKLGTEVIISGLGGGIPRNFSSSVNKLYIINSIETDGEPTAADIKKAKEIEAEDPLTRYTKNILMNFDRANNDKVFNVVMFRNNLTGISATSFVKTMKTLAEASAAFLPDHISLEEKYALIGDMISEFGINLH